MVRPASAVQRRAIADGSFVTRTGGFKTDFKLSGYLTGCEGITLLERYEMRLSRTLQTPIIETGLAGA